MRLKAYSLISLSLFLSFEAKAASYEITQQHLRTHVKFLSSDDLEGRLTGSLGEKLATDYIAKRFQELGLMPAGDNGTYFQTFDFTAGVTLGDKNSLVVTDQNGRHKTLILNQDWRPLTFSDNSTFSHPTLIEAGYGITAPGYDSYKGLNVKDKWVIVFRYLPNGISKQLRQNLNAYSSLRQKTLQAKEHGATGIIFIKPPNAKNENELIPLRLDTTSSLTGITAISMQAHLLKNDLKISGQVDIKKSIRHGRNVLAKLQLPLAKQMIVIGAHADHLGHGEISSRARSLEKGMIHNGADDNASGVASMLEAAAKLCDLKAQGRLIGNKDILFAAWSGEEFGIIGSEHFAKQLMATAHSQSLRPLIATAINLDMVGHLREKLALQGLDSSLEWPKVVAELKAKHSLSLITQNDPYLPTDSTSFYLHGVPTLNFFTGAHDDYHTPRDKPDSLNYLGIKNITELLVDLTLLLEKKTKPIAYHQANAGSDHIEREFKVYLGTIPDYVSADITGVKLSGVAKDSPADLAGIQPDDIIIALANKPIHDIYDYTFALNALPIGKPVKLIVLRKHSQVALKITARYR